MKVVWTLPALADIDQIQDFVAAESPAAAHRLTNDIIDRTEALLADMPLAGRPGRVAGTRELVLVQTSYIVAYRVTERIEILAVVNAAREWPEEFG